MTHLKACSLSRKRFGRASGGILMEFMTARTHLASSSAHGVVSNRQEFISGLLWKVTNFKLRCFATFSEAPVHHDSAFEGFMRFLKFDRRLDEVAGVWRYGAADVLNKCARKLFFRRISQYSPCLSAFIVGGTKHPPVAFPWFLLGIAADRQEICSLPSPVACSVGRSLAIGGDVHRAFRNGDKQISRLRNRTEA